MPPSPAPTPPTPPNRVTDLEIKDAQIIFGAVWQELEAEYGRDNLRFPKEIILLGGAPGSGKGTNTDFHRQDPRPDLRADRDQRPAGFARGQADEGRRQHGRGPRGRSASSCASLLQPEYRDGVILDGFPRTKVQVECLKLLVDKMHAAAAGVLPDPARDPLPPADDPHHGALRRREDQRRAPAPPRPRGPRCTTRRSAGPASASSRRSGRPISTRPWRSGGTASSRSRPGTPSRS